MPSRATPRSRTSTSRPADAPVASLAYPDRVRSAALLLVLVFAVAACGTAEETAPEPTGISAEQVSDHFAEEAGRPLEPTQVEGEAWEQLGYGLNANPSVVQRFGTFNVYVVEPGNDEALRSLLSDKATGEPLEPDDRGIYWELDSQSRTWVAHSRYGPNVVLTWFSENTRKTADARWERLNSVLSGLETTS